MAAVAAEEGRRELPRSVEAEQALLGSLLADPQCYPAVARSVSTQSFFRFEHRLIFGAIGSIIARGGAVDPVTVFEQLDGEVGDYGGLQYLNELASCVPTAANAASYASIVRDRELRREAVGLGDQLARAALQPGGDIRGLAEVTRQLVGRLDCASNSSPLEFQWAGSLGEELASAPQLVERLLSVGGLSAVMGPPGAAKSFFVSSLCMALAAGRSFMGRRVRQSGWVLYVAAEGADSVRGRLQAARKHLGHEHGSFALLPQGLNLLDPSPDVDALIRTAQVVAEAAGGGAGIIAIDTAARVTPGADENSGQDMGRFITALERVRSSTGAHVLVVHHTGKDLARGARGHSSLKAALDTEILVTVDDATKVRRVKVTKQRDLPGEGDEFSFRLLPVDLGVDEWGNPVTSCVVESCDQAQDAAAPRRLTATQAAVLAYLAGRQEGVRRGAISDALAAQGSARSAVYKSVAELVAAGQLIDERGLIYAPKS